MSFCTAINCMDGRVQEPVIKYLKEKYKVLFVDMITEAGPVKILANNENIDIQGAIFKRVDISVNIHGSKYIAIVAHDDCAGNPLKELEQKKQLDQAEFMLKEKYPNLEIIKLWLGVDFKVCEV